MEHTKTPAWEKYLSLAAEEPLKHYREVVEELGPNPGWARIQQAFRTVSRKRQRSWKDS